MRDIRDLETMKRMKYGGDPGFFGRIIGRTPEPQDISDVVYHYECPICGKKKKITVKLEDQYHVAPGLTRLDVVLMNENRCVTCSRADGAF